MVEYTDVSIGAGSADLFSNVGGSAGLKVKSLWSYKPDRDLRLLLEGDDLDPEGLTLQVGGLRLPFPAGSSTGISFKWTDVDVDWEDGQTLAARIGRNTLATGAPSISGTVQVGETLTAHTTGIADADGLDGATFGYQWVSNDGNATRTYRTQRTQRTPWSLPMKVRPSRCACPSPTEAVSRSHAPAQRRWLWHHRRTLRLRALPRSAARPG